jgi:hypothetical protein
VLSSWLSGCCFRTWRTVREEGADSPHGAFWPNCSSCSSCVLEHLRFDPIGQWLLVESGLADSRPGRRGQSAQHELLADRPRTWYGPSACGGAGWVVLLVFNRPSAVWRGPSPLGPRTVRQDCCRTAKSFASWFVLPLWDHLGFVPRVGTSVVTTRPWQNRVGILGCEFGV